jgi:hypothetical protein
MRTAVRGAGARVVRLASGDDRRIGYGAELGMVYGASLDAGELLPEGARVPACNLVIAGQDEHAAARAAVIMAVLAYGFGRAEAVRPGLAGAQRSLRNTAIPALQKMTGQVRPPNVPRMKIA